ncbi:hypothetical protein AWB66_01809 [Caballeronia telluris]|uniref:Uncharacterized protein n=1 Tax=Caballeronia telluris TaxID=326475 RepID=A0A158GFU6_9BURK|nr:hypothetical protein AWB66_01809 [Caballeronia telluris]
MTPIQIIGTIAFLIVIALAVVGVVDVFRRRQTSGGDERHSNGARMPEPTTSKASRLSTNESKAKENGFTP